MHVAGQVEVKVLHRDHLAVAAARGAALDPEYGTERRLADRDGGRAADPTEALREPDGRRGLAFAERRRRHRGHDHVLPARALPLGTVDRLEPDLRLRGPVLLDLVVVKTELARDFDDRSRRDRASDLEIGGK